MSVDTNTKGKNLDPYRRVRHGNFQILVTPKISGLASLMTIDVTSGFRKKLHVELSDGSGGACGLE